MSMRISWACQYLAVEYLHLVIPDPIGKGQMKNEYKEMQKE